MGKDQVDPQDHGEISGQILWWVNPLGKVKPSLFETVFIVNTSLCKYRKNAKLLDADTQLVQTHRLLKHPDTILSVGNCPQS